MRKNIDLHEDDAKFLADYKKSHGINASKFIDMAIREKIIKTKLELNLCSYSTVK